MFAKQIRSRSAASSDESASPPRSSSCRRRQRSADRCCDGCRWRWRWPSRTGLPPVWPQSSSGSSEQTELVTLVSTLRPVDARVVCTWRQSARRCSSLCGRASRGESAPSGSSRICGPWHSTWRHVSLCTFRLLGFPSLLNRKDLFD